MGRFENSFSITGLDTLQYVRHFVQFVTFLWCNAKIFGIAATGIIVPYLHVTESPFSVVHGAYESLEYSIARGVFPLLVLGVIYLTAITVGRVFCGWACPMGMVQDILSYLPFKKQKLSANALNQFKDIKWAVLGFSIMCVLIVAWRRAGSAWTEDPIGAFSDSPFSVISPSGTLFAYIPWMALWNTNVLATAGMTAWIKMAVLVAVLVPSIYVPRFFCRFLCPMGALIELTSQYKMLKIRWKSKLARENLNAILNDVCPMGVQMGKDSSEYIDHPGCIHCGKCITEDPKNLSPTLLESN